MTSVSFTAMAQPRGRSLTLVAARPRGVSLTTLFLTSLQITREQPQTLREYKWLYTSSSVFTTGSFMKSLPS
ncbi:D-xylose ABC transporter substrate-binding protein [Sesbania bispinosa]|nr:D-xylose ABC transporter substrate-binding protein [Sesbania bispinosa]